MKNKGKRPALPAGRQKAKGKILFLFLFCNLLFIITPSYAKDVTILYSGSTHAMIYTCSCPLQIDGGVARRATLVRQLREKYPGAILLDVGSFFAGGLLDEFTQNTQLDMQRTLVNLKSMELMKYDAAALSDDEFNFGREFLRDNISKTAIAFLSCNVGMDKALPYMIKEVAGQKLGIIGVTTLSAMSKAEGIKFIEPKMAVSKAVEELRARGVNIIIILSSLSELENRALIDSVKGINVIFSSNKASGNESSTRIGDTLLVNSAWQGRKLGRLTFSVSGGKVSDYRLEELRLSDEITDDPGILKILPRCFSDANCKKTGLIGSCQKGGSLEATCSFSEPNKIFLTIITAKDCEICNTAPLTEYLKRVFPGLAVTQIYYTDKKGQKLMKDLGISGLPAYLLGKEVAKEEKFDLMKASLDLKGDYYMMKPEVAGLSYLTDRKRIKGKVDIFMSLFDKYAPGLIEAVRALNPTVHLLSVENEGSFDSAKGKAEVEENLRSICVQKYYPQKFWDYIACRSKDINSTWWEDCAAGMDTEKLRICAKGQEGSSLLRANIGLNKELRVMFGPAYLLDNQEVFSTQGEPSKDELTKMLTR